MNDAALANIKEDHKQKINLVEQGKNNTNGDKGDKYSIKSNLINLNIETKKLDEINILEKTGENSDKSLNLKTSVKSKFILKKIFLILDEKKKLLLLRYNKYYQKLMVINIEKYQELSNKIIIGGINGYGKEYEFEELNLIYKGYYMNGKRNGKGKEYNGDIIFEGEYKNGIKNGKGIEYNKKGILFVGEYLKGKRWNGIFKEYHINSNLKKFYGHYCEGNKIGKEYDIYGHLIFEGKYLDDKRWNGIIYNNGFLYPIENGNGKVEEYSQYGKLIFKGEYLNGVKKGKEYKEESFELSIFEGEYCNEKRWNGKIKEYKKREGPVLDWNHCCVPLPRSFDSIRRDICGDIDIEKIFILEKLKKHEKILKYEGEYLNGERNGKGKEYDIKGNLIFEGEYLNGTIKKKEKRYKNNYFE